MLLKLTVRSLAAHRLRMALTAVAVVLGVGFTSGTLIFSATLDRGIDRALADFGAGTDAVVRAHRTIDAGLGEPPSDLPVPASLLPAVTRTAGVAKAYGTVSGSAAVVGRKGRIIGQEPRTGTAWNPDRDLSLMRLKAGHAPRTATEVAIDENLARESGYRIGDRVTVALATGGRTFTLAGIFSYGGSDLASALSVVAFEPRTAQRLLMPRADVYREIIVHGREGVPQERLRAALAAVVPSGYEVVTGDQVIAEKKEPIDEVLGALDKILLAFGLIAVFVGSFIIFNTFSMLVGRRARELALLRAVGASRAQVTRAVLGEAAGVGLAGSTLGLLAGAGVARALLYVLSTVLGGELGVHGLSVPSAAVVTAYAVGMTVTLAAAYVPARRAAGIPPVAALRDELEPPARSLRWRARAGAVAALAGGALLAASFAGTGDGAMLTAGLGALALFAGFVLLSPVVSGPATAFLGRPLTRLLGAPGTLGRRNAQRNPRRTAATASALMIGLALIGTVSVVTHSMTRSMDRQLEAGLPADFQIASTSRTAALGQPVLEAVAKVPGVRTAVPIRTVRLRLGGTAQDAMTGDPRRLVDHFRLRLEEGTVGGLVVDRATATAHGWRAGSAVPVEYQDGAKATLPLSGIYANVRTVLPTVPNAIVDERAAGPHYPGTGVQRIDVTGAPTRRALDAALARWPDVEAEDRATLRHEAAASIDLILDLTVALLMLSVVIAALGIANTLALSVIERTREIGVLRALGMQRRQLRRMIRYEAVVISLYGAVLGLGFGLLLGIAVRHAMAGEGVDTLAIPYARLAVQLPAAALIGTLAAAWPAHRAATMNPLEAITHTQT